MEPRRMLKMRVSIVGLGLMILQSLLLWCVTSAGATTRLETVRTLVETLQDYRTTAVESLKHFENIQSEKKAEQLFPELRSSFNECVFELGNLNKSMDTGSEQDWSKRVDGIYDRFNKVNQNIRKFNEALDQMTPVSRVSASCVLFEADKVRQQEAIKKALKSLPLPSFKDILSHAQPKKQVSPNAH